MVNQNSDVTQMVAGWPYFGNRILLAEKAEGNDIGYLMAPGGHVELGETKEQAMVRELREELGYNEETGKGIAAEIADLELVGTLFQRQFKDEASYRNGIAYSKMEFSLYLIHTDGIAVDTIEMRNAEWYDQKALPFWRMLERDRVLLPLILSGNRIRANVAYVRSPRQLMECTLTMHESRFVWR